MQNGKYRRIEGANTHYFEGGEQHRGQRPSVLLLHSAEYGGAAEISWERNFDALAARYHVLAPDHLGFGRSDKLFDFGGDLYGKTLEITFVGWIRGEEKFDSIDALVARMNEDSRLAREMTARG